MLVELVDVVAEDLGPEEALEELPVLRIRLLENFLADLRNVDLKNRELESVGRGSRYFELSRDAEAHQRRGYS